MPGLEQTIIAFACGACIALISSSIGYLKFRKKLRKCLADSNCTNTFEYKGKLYSTEKYMQLQYDEYCKVSKSDLKKWIKHYEKSFDKGKLSNIQILDLNAMKFALEDK